MWQHIVEFSVVGLPLAFGEWWLSVAFYGIDRRVCCSHTEMSNNLDRPSVPCTSWLSLLFFGMMKAGQYDPFSPSVRFWVSVVSRLAKAMSVIKHFPVQTPLTLDP